MKLDREEQTGVLDGVSNVSLERPHLDNQPGPYVITLPKFNIAPEKLPKPNRKGSSSNHHFSGAMLNFGGVMYIVQYIHAICSARTRRQSIASTSCECKPDVSHLLPNHMSLFAYCGRISIEKKCLPSGYLSHILYLWVVTSSVTDTKDTRHVRSMLVEIYINAVVQIEQGFLIFTNSTHVHPNFLTLPLLFVPSSPPLTS